MITKLLRAKLVMTVKEGKYSESRRKMVEEQISRRGINDSRLINAFLTVPRHLFVPEENRDWAYSDGPLPIGFGQTISQPYIVALMTDLLKLKGDERVLEIGTGSGYQAAILACMAKEVHTVEYIPELAANAMIVLASLDLKNVACHIGDGSQGWEKAAPYDGILVAAAAPKIPRPLLEQLDEGGRLVVPVGGHGFQELECWQKTGESFAQEVITPVAFVPLRGQFGWDKPW